MIEGRYRLRGAALVAATVLAAGGCVSTAPQAPPSGARTGDTAGPAAPVTGMSAAGSALLGQSRSERRSGNYAQAGATLERALRVEPTASAIWLELARVRLLEGNFVQAEQIARKAHSLAGADSSLAAESRALAAEALRRQGREREAEALLSDGD